MDDCMRALQKTFQSPLPDPIWQEEQEQAWDALHEVLSKEERKLLLHLVDANSMLLGETSLHSFICGFKLGMKLNDVLHEK